MKPRFFVFNAMNDSFNDLVRLPLQPTDITNLLEQIGEADLIAITAHQNPDGDAVGSVLGLFHALKFAGKNCVCILPDRYPDFLAWMPGTQDIILFDEQKEKATVILNTANLVFCLDYNAPERTGKEMGEVLQKAPGFKVMIDHHPEPKDFCNITINYPQDCSTCQLIYRVIHTIGYTGHIQAPSATCLYTGIMTDTGSFRYPSTTAVTHYIVARLIEAGAPNSKIHEQVGDSNTEGRLRLVGFALSQKLVVLPQHATAYLSLTEKELEQFNYQKGDTEGLVNYGLSIKGIQMAAIFMEKDGMVKISFRSKGNVPVNTFMSTHFSGGGHKNAAGGRSHESLDVTIRKFLSLIPELMQPYLHE